MIEYLDQFVPFSLPIAMIFVLIVFVVLAFFREWMAPDLVALSALGVILVLGLLPLTDVIVDGKIVSRGLLSVFSNGAPITTRRGAPDQSKAGR